MAQRFFKQSPALEDYDFDWSGWLVDGDFITGYTVTADDGVTLGDVSHQQGSPIIKQFVGGGTHGNSYKVTCAIQTDQGRADVAQVIILIRDIGTGGQPVAPPLPEGDDMPPVITDITSLITFPQPGVALVVIPSNGIQVIRTGKLMTIMLDFQVNISLGTLNHIEIKLPLGYEAQQGFDFVGTYNYNYSPPPIPAGDNIPGTMFIQSLTGSDRLALYPKNYTTFPITDNFYIAGQLTYVAQT